MKRRFIASVAIIGLVIPTNSYAADSVGPKVIQRSSTGSEDATNSGVFIDIYYEVEDESGLDETKIPETFLRLPGKEYETSLRSRPSLISGNKFKGSWLARFSYPKGIPPGIYVASTDKWYDIYNNESLIPSNVTIRVDNLNISSASGVNVKPTNIKCNPPNQVDDSEITEKNLLITNFFCTFTANSLRNGLKVNAFLDKIPASALNSKLDYANEIVIYPKILGSQKIGRTFNITGVVSGEYILRIVLEFLDYPDLRQSFTIKLAKSPLPTPSPMATTALTSSPTPSPMATTALTSSPTPTPVSSPSPNSSKIQNTNTPALKSKTIICIKGKLIKKVIGINPKCPSGYKKK